MGINIPTYFAKTIKERIKKRKKRNFRKNRAAAYGGCRSFSIDWWNVFHALSNQ